MGGGRGAGGGLRGQGPEDRHKRAGEVLIAACPARSARSALPCKACSKVRGEKLSDRWTGGQSGGGACGAALRLESRTLRALVSHSPCLPSCLLPPSDPPPSSLRHFLSPHPSSHEPRRVRCSGSGARTETHRNGVMTERYVTASSDRGSTTARTSRRKRQGTPKWVPEKVVWIKDITQAPPAGDRKLHKTITALLRAGIGH